MMTMMSIMMVRRHPWPRIEKRNLCAPAGLIVGDELSVLAPIQSSIALRVRKQARKVSREKMKRDSRLPSLSLSPRDLGAGARPWHWEESTDCLIDWTRLVRAS
jgi:hypothetical protein